MTVPTPDTSSSVSTIDRRARNAFVADIALMAVALLMSVRRIAFAFSHAVSWQIYGDIAVILLFFLATLYSARLIRRGMVDAGVQTLIAAFLFNLIARDAFISGLGTYFAIAAALIPLLIAVVALEPKAFHRVEVYSLLAATFIVLYDLYAPPYRQPIEMETLRPAIGIAVGAVSLIALLSLLRERQRILLSSKISIAAIFILIIPIIGLRLVGGYTLRKSYQHQLQQTLLNQSHIIANTMDGVINTALDNTRVEGQLPIFSDYLTARTPEEKETYKEEAMRTLRSLRYRDLTFIDSYAVLNRWGTDVLDTDADSIGNNEYNQDYFRASFQNGLPYISNPKYDAKHKKTYIYISAPIRTEDRQIVGVLRVRYNAYILQTYINGYDDIAGKGSYAIMLKEAALSPTDKAFIVLADGKTPSLRFRSVTPLDSVKIDALRRNDEIPPGTGTSLNADIPGLDSALRQIDRQPIFSVIQNDEREILAATKMKTTGWIIAIAQNEAASFAPMEIQGKSISATAAVFTLIFALIAAWGANKLLEPLSKLQETAEAVAAGNLDAKAPIETSDEIGIFAKVFNEMAAQLRDLIDSLETRIEERTQALQKRAKQLQIAAEVGSAAASMRDLDALLFRTTQLISEQFGFYHVGIFLLDAKKEFAILKAANSPGGRRMLARHHKLEVGKVGIVGYATGHGEARIALDVGEDAVFFNNPDLPKTRSEMALPLIVAGEVVGALDIQSEEPAAFVQDDIETLQVLADQIAIAIENARLFTENQKALESLQRAYGEISREAWKSMLKRETRRFIGTERGVSVESEEETPDELTQKALKERTPILQDHTLLIPLMVRGQSIGALRLSKPDNAPPWSEEEVEIAQTFTDQLGAALESARLYNEATRRAVIERAIGEIAAKISASIRMENILQTTAKELGRLLDDADIVVQLAEEEPSSEDTHV